MVQRSLISDQDKVQIKRTFRKDLKADVYLGFFTHHPSLLTVPVRECPSGPQAQQLLEELSALSPKLHLEIFDFFAKRDVADQFGVDKIPAVAVGRMHSATVTFYGTPNGYELATIVEDIKTVSRGVTPLSMDTRKKLRQLEQQINIQVFVTPTCTYSPLMARLVHAVDLESPLVKSDVIEIQEFPALGQRLGIQSVPMTIINDTIRLAGTVSEPELIEKILQVGTSRINAEYEDSD